MDNRIIRILNLEREVFRLSREVDRLNQQQSRGRTLLGTIGSNAGQSPLPTPPGGDGSGYDGSGNGGGGDTVPPVTPPSDTSPTYCQDCFGGLPNTLALHDSYNKVDVTLNKGTYATYVVYYGNFVDIRYELTCNRDLTGSNYLLLLAGFDLSASYVDKATLVATSSLDCVSPTGTFHFPPGSPLGTIYPNGSTVTVS